MTILGEQLKAAYARHNARDTSGYGYAFHNIPNTEEGRTLIAGLKRYANHALVSVRVRTNGPRKGPAMRDGYGPRGYDQDLPARHAERFRVYLYDAPAIAERKRAHRPSPPDLAPALAAALSQRDDAQRQLNAVPAWILYLVAWWRA